MCACTWLFNFLWYFLFPEVRGSVKEIKAKKQLEEESKTSDK